MYEAMRSLLCLLPLLALQVQGQSSSDATDTRSFSTISGTIPVTVSGSYASATSQISVSQSSRLVNAPTAASPSSSSGSSATITSQGSTSTITLLQGGGLGVQTLSVINGTVTLTASRNGTSSTSSTSTSTASAPVNTQPCNGWPEFCARKYSNITQVAAHNAAFVVKGNAGSNQEYSMTQQLNDGVRMLTGEVQYVNNTFYSCHTSCDLLNAGTFVSNLQEIASWVSTHPYDVVTLLIVNSDTRPATDYISDIQSSGLSPYLYTPPLVPMHLSDWPTLSEMILHQQRVVIFMDYEANQTAVPYILDEFTHMWETPFSPQDVNFPCTLERPPTLTNDTVARDDYMYLANHNLNQAISFAGTSFLIPNTAAINNTNAAGNETGMLGQMADTCQRQWGRAPNWLLVDYYDRVAGSVFEVAAKWNNVTYDRTCCGQATSGAAPARVISRSGSLGLATCIIAVMALLL